VKGDTLNVIIRPDLKKMLQSFKKDYGTEKAIVESILDAFSEFTPEQQRAVLLNPKNFNPFAVLLAQNDWSAHTFTLAHWPWAVQCYKSLAQQYKNHTDYSTFALYREGYAWMGFAIELRAKALEQQDNRVLWRDLFDAAIDSVERGIVANNQADPSESPTPFVLYNSACGYSLCAQFTIEKALQENCPWADALRNKNDAKDATPKKKQADPWAEIGRDWRKEKGNETLFRSGIDTESVETNAQKAVASLKSLVALHEKSEKKRTDNETAEPSGVGLLPWPDPSFFRLRSKHDPDITFLAHDREYSKEFNDWRQGEKKQPDEEAQWLLGTYHRLISEK
jgi:hypothetical protein